MELNFKKDLLNAKGVITGAKLNEVLSELLLQASVKPPTSTKFFLWALELEKSGTITLDAPDKETLLKFVDEHDTLIVLARERLREVITQPDLKK